MESGMLCNHRQGYIASVVALKASSLLYVIAVALTFWIHPPSPRDIPFGWLVVVQTTQVVSVILVTVGFVFSAVVHLLKFHTKLDGVCSTLRHNLTTCRLDCHRVSGVGGLLGWLGTVIYVGNINFLSAIVPAFFVAFFSSAAIAVSAVAVEILKDPELAKTAPPAESLAQFPRIKYPAVVKSSWHPPYLSVEDLCVHGYAMKPLLPNQTESGELETEKE